MDKNYFGKLLIMTQLILRLFSILSKTVCIKSIKSLIQYTWYMFDPWSDEWGYKAIKKKPFFLGFQQKYNNHIMTKLNQCNTKHYSSWKFGKMKSWLH
jgi:hypothetical protein